MTDKRPLCRDCGKKACRKMKLWWTYAALFKDGSEGNIYPFWGGEVGMNIYFCMNHFKIFMRKKRRRENFLKRRLRQRRSRIKC
jgi:hypothetical protein